MRNSIFPAFFEGNHYFIDERVGLLKFSNSYKVYDETGSPLGEIVQRISGWHKFLRLLLNKVMFPFTMEVVDLQGVVQTVIRRGWTFFMSKIEVLDASGQVLGRIRQKFRFFQHQFEITDALGQPLALIRGDWKAWNFTITNPAGQQIGIITKKWNGFLKEAFTTADKYVVSIEPDYAEDINKIIVVSSAITIDMVLKESK